MVRIRHWNYRRTYWTGMGWSNKRYRGVRFSSMALAALVAQVVSRKARVVRVVRRCLR
jgi:hypothetical protein